ELSSVWFMRGGSRSSLGSLGDDSSGPGHGATVGQILDPDLPPSLVSCFESCPCNSTCRFPVWSVQKFAPQGAHRGGLAVRQAFLRGNRSKTAAMRRRTHDLVSSLNEPQVSPAAAGT